jgi:thiosulfate reductase cytochrome b subunit
MWFFTLNGIVYVLYTFLSGEWRNLIPTRHSFVGAFHVVLHDLGLNTKQLPRKKFNDAQRIAYTGVVLMGMGSVLTGLFIYNTPENDSSEILTQVRDVNRRRPDRAKPCRSRRFGPYG